MICHRPCEQRASPGTRRQFQSTSRTILFCSVSTGHDSALSRLFRPLEQRDTYLLTYLLSNCRAVQSKLSATTMAGNESRSVGDANALLLLRILHSFICFFFLLISLSHRLYTRFSFLVTCSRDLIKTLTQLAQQSLLVVDDFIS